MGNRRMLETVIAPSPEAACARAADVVEALLAARPTAVLALPVGATPRPVYADLRRRYAAGALSFARATAFSLDEYVGLGRDDARSFHRTLCDQLYDHVDLMATRVHAPDGAAADPDAAAARYERAIADAGGLDLVLLGIGGNGHIAFNEPGSAFASHTRLVALAPETRAGAAAGFGGADAVPTHALTIGIATILAARHCVLLAHGAGKAAIVARALEAPIDTGVPASALRLHANATVILDAAAASRLTPARP
jgi:glucosamine-6-phosphate deaminase